MQFLLRYRQRIRGRQICRPRISYFGLTEPLLEFFQRDDLAVAFLLFFSGFLAPSIKLLVGDAPGFDPRKALFVFLAVRLENGVVGLLFRPLAERADLAAALFAVLHRTLAILCAHAPGLRKPAGAVLAAANRHAALDAASQRRFLFRPVPEMSADFPEMEASAAWTADPAFQTHRFQKTPSPRRNTSLHATWLSLQIMVADLATQRKSARNLLLCRLQRKSRPAAATVGRRAAFRKTRTATVFSLAERPPKRKFFL